MVGHVLYSTKYFNKIKKDPKYREMASKIKRINPREIYYYGDAYPDVFNLVMVMRSPDNKLIVADSSEYGLYYVSQVYKRDKGYESLANYRIPFYIVISSVDPKTLIKFKGLSKWRIEELANKVNYPLNPVGDKYTFEAGDIRKIHELLIEKYPYNK